MIITTLERRGGGGGGLRRYFQAKAERTEILERQIAAVDRIRNTKISTLGQLVKRFINLNDE